MFVFLACKSSKTRFLARINIGLWAHSTELATWRSSYDGSISFFGNASVLGFNSSSVRTTVYYARYKCVSFVLFDCIFVWFQNRASLHEVERSDAAAGHVDRTCHANWILCSVSTLGTVLSRLHLRCIRRSSNVSWFGSISTNRKRTTRQQQQQRRPSPGDIQLHVTCRQQSSFGLSRLLSVLTGCWQRRQFARFLWQSASFVSWSTTAFLRRHRGFSADHLPLTFSFLRAGLFFASIRYGHLALLQVRHFFHFYLVWWRLRLRTQNSISTIAAFWHVNAVVTLRFSDGRCFCFTIRFSCARRSSCSGTYDFALHVGAIATSSSPVSGGWSGSVFIAFFPSQRRDISSCGFVRVAWRIKAARPFVIDPHRIDVSI